MSSIFRGNIRFCRAIYNVTSKQFIQIVAMNILSCERYLIKRCGHLHASTGEYNNIHSPQPPTTIAYTPLAFAFSVASSLLVRIIYRLCALRRISISNIAKISQIKHSHIRLTIEHTPRFFPPVCAAIIIGVHIFHITLEQRLSSPLPPRPHIQPQCIYSREFHTHTHSDISSQSANCSQTNTSTHKTLIQ